MSDHDFESSYRERLINALDATARALENLSRIEIDAARSRLRGTATVVEDEYIAALAKRQQQIAMKAIDQVQHTPLRLTLSFDESYHCLDCNSMFTLVTGYSRDELLHA